MEKNSFTLFETLISITILSIIIASFLQNSFYDNFDKEYMLLNSLENSFTTKTYDKNFINRKRAITIIKNDNFEENILIKEIFYQNKNIKLSKYELINE